MTSPRLPTADEYRKEAEKMRAQAAASSEPIRQQLLAVAAEYDELAETVETMA
jgi:hypothetical protein